MTHQILADYKMNNHLLLSICVITCVGFAYLLHIAIEKPFMKLRNRLI